jgi:GNAT superfamily N-acetyltransferase
VSVHVRRLQPSDDRSGFKSGNAELDRFFTQYAGQNQFRHHIGTTYVAVGEAGRLEGFVTVTASEIPPVALPRAKGRRLPKHALPVLRLARLAVDGRAAGRGVGTVLVRSVFAIARQLAESVGCLGIVVDAKPAAVAFYERLGFIRLEPVGGQLGDRPEPLPMFLELAQLAEERHDRARR